MAKKKFSWRAFISFGLTYSFIIILLTGIVLYIAPAGRIAHWVNWKFLGLLKEDWQSIHTIFSYTFAVLSIFHLLSVNWKAFLSYFRSKAKEGFNKKREFIISTVMILAFFLAVIFNVPPFSSVIDLGENITNSWEEKYTEPPIPHLEQYTLRELAEEFEDINIVMIENRLKAASIEYTNLDETLEIIGKANNTPPLEIYNIIKAGQGGKNAGMGKGIGSGSGIGRKSLVEYATEYNKNLDSILLVLEKNEIKANASQTIREIAGNNNMAPPDLLKLID